MQQKRVDALDNCLRQAEQGHEAIRITQWGEAAFVAVADQRASARACACRADPPAL